MPLLDLAQRQVGAETNTQGWLTKDRIFTNLYGFQPWTLAAARKRGDWDNTKALLAKGKDGIIERSRRPACAAAAARASRPG
jgi:NADH:ubiquinone oxidoreductase subunit F (NADH-binding)